MTIPEDAPRFGASPSDMIAIEQAALDYMEGWFTGDAKRVRRALHPQLVKRTLVIDPETGKPTNEFYGSTAEQLPIALTYALKIAACRVVEKFLSRGLLRSAVPDAQGANAVDLLVEWQRFADDLGQRR